MPSRGAFVTLSDKLSETSLETKSDTIDNLDDLPDVCSSSESQ